MYKPDSNKTSLGNMLGMLDHYKDSPGYIYVLVKLPNQEKPELIINKPGSMVTKVPYYSNSYNPDLTLKANHEVRILQYGWLLELEDAEELFEEEL